MIKSESIKELAGALSKFTGEVTNPKNTARNPQFNSKYAPLQDILSLVRPLLSKQGLSLLQSTTGDLENVTISTTLLHESGEFLEMEPFTLRGEQTLKGGAKVLNVQGAGSMITYIRRYQISALLGLSSEDDDDGDYASKKNNSTTHNDNKPPYKAPQTPSNNHSAIISDGQAKRLYAISKGNTELAKKVLLEYGYTSSKLVENKDYKLICDEIEKAVGEK